MAIEGSRGHLTQFFLPDLDSQAENMLEIGWFCVKNKLFEALMPSKHPRNVNLGV